MKVRRDYLKPLVYSDMIAYYAGPISTWQIPRNLTKAAITGNFNSLHTLIKDLCEYKS